MRLAITAYVSLQMIQMGISPVLLAILITAAGYEDWITIRNKR
jgi:hypothetical protein